jgi:hypothetical protein
VLLRQGEGQKGRKRLGQQPSHVTSGSAHYTQVSSLQQQLRGKDGDISRLTQEVDVIKGVCAHITTDKSTIIAGLHKRVEGLEKTLASTEEDHTKTRSEHTEAKEKLEEAEAQRHQLHCQLQSDTTKDFNQCVDELDELRIKLEAFEHMHSRTAQELQACRKEHDGLLLKLHVSKNLQFTTTAQLKGSEGHYDELQAKLQASEELLIFQYSTADELRECQDEYDTLRAAVGASGEEKKRLADAKGNLESKVAGLEQTLEEEESAHDRTSDDLGACEEKLEEINEELMDVLEQLEAAETMKVSLIEKSYKAQDVENKLAAVTKEIEELKTLQNTIITKISEDTGQLPQACESPHTSTERKQYDSSESPELNGGYQSVVAAQEATSDKGATSTEQAVELTHEALDVSDVANKLTIDKNIETAADLPLKATSHGDDAVANSVGLVTDFNQSSNERDDATSSPDIASLSQSSSVSSLEAAVETANLPAPSKLELPSPASGISTMVLGAAALGVGAWDEDKEDAAFVPRGFTTSIAEQPLAQPDEQFSTSSIEMYPSEGAISSALRLALVRWSSCHHHSSTSSSRATATSFPESPCPLRSARSRSSMCFLRTGTSSRSSCGLYLPPFQRR